MHARALPGQRSLRLATLAVAAMLAVFVAVTPSSAAKPDDAGPKPDKRVKVIVRYEDRPGASDVARLKAAGGKVRFRYRNLPAIAATMPAKALDDVRGQRGVRRVSLDHQVVAFEHGGATGDPELERSWGVEHIGAGRAHTAGELGQGIRVAIIDTGIDCTHPDLDDRCDPGISYIASAPFVGGVPFDDYGHGTHVAGIVGAERNSDDYGVVGVSPNVRLVAMKVLDASGSGDYSGVIAALDQITTWNNDANNANDVEVVNMSLGGHEVSADLAQAVSLAWSSGAVLVAASGNVDPFNWMELFYGCQVAYPAAYPQVFATTFTDINDALTGYSCTGPEVDFAAPGDQVSSSVPASGGPMASPSRFFTASGTSMASPHLAGTAALLLAYGMPDANGNGNRQDEIRSHLCATARQGFGVLQTPIPPSDPRYPTYFGCGVVNAGRALVDEPPGPPPPPPPPPPNTPPVADAGQDYEGPEGSPVALDGTGTDADGDPLTRSWTWKKVGGVDAGADCSIADATKADTSITCTDDGAYSVTFTVDDGEDSDADTALLAISNADPIASIDSPTAGATFETGEQVAVGRTVTDPGANDSRTCVIDWGDAASTPCADGPHAYAVAGGVLMTLTVTDDDGGVATDSVGIDVVEPPPNEPPQVDAGPDRSGQEGAALQVDGSATDPGDPGLTRSWSVAMQGDVDEGTTCDIGSPQQGNTTISCTDDGSFVLTLTADDGVNPPVSDAMTLTLDNVAPTLTVTKPVPGAQFEVGETVQVERTVDDPGSNDPRDCDVDWGGTTTPCSEGHAYGSAGERTLTVTVRDHDGGSDSDSVTVTIVDPPPPPPPPPATVELTFTPVADAYVSSNRPNANYGTANRLRVKNGTIRSYLRFAVSGVSGQVVDAKLRLFVAESSNNGGIARAVTNVTWGEQSITWQNKPALGATLEAAGAVTSGTWVELDLGSVVTGNGAWSFAVATGSSDRAQFHSREASRDPVLVLTVQP